MRELRRTGDLLYGHVRRIVSSDYFFYAVLVLASLQALWYAYSFVPWVNDEARHFANILIYADRLSPFLGRQPPAWDHLGEITRDSSFMFYYLMSWPLRLVRAFTADPGAQLIALRLLCIAMFVSALAVYRLALLRISKVPKGAIHLLFLFFTLIPSVTILSATVNYDNMAFLIFACMLLLAVRIVKSRALVMPVLAGFVILGLLLTVVKWTGAALYLPLGLYVVYVLLRKYGRDLVPQLWAAARRTSRLQLVLLGIALVIGLGLFIERPVYNMLHYGKPTPSCPAIIGAQRCLAFHDYVANERYVAEKPAGFQPLNPVSYLLYDWTPRMVETADNVFEGAQTYAPVLIKLFWVLTAAAVVITLVAWLWLWRDPWHRFMLFVSAVYVFFLVLDEYSSYRSVGAPAAIRFRYLIPIMPLLMYPVLRATLFLFGKYRELLLATVIVLLLVMTQGGGFITYALTTPQSAYWPDAGVRRVNSAIRSTLQRVVKV